MNPALTPEEAVRVAREAIILAICERTTAALRTNDGDKVVLTDVFDAYRDALLTAERARLAARVEGMRMEYDQTDVKFWIRMDHQREDCDRNLRIVTHNAACDTFLALLREAK